MSDLDRDGLQKRTSAKRWPSIEIRECTPQIRFSTKQKPPGFAGRFFRLTNRISYSLLPKRRDHHPARRGWVVSVVASEAGGAGAGAADGSGWLRSTGAAAASGWVSTRKLPFSRTVERRRAALSAS